MHNKHVLAVVVPALLLLGGALYWFTRPGGIGKTSCDLICEVNQRTINGEEGRELILDTPKYQLSPGKNIHFQVFVPESEYLDIVSSRTGNQVVYTLPGGQQYNPSRDAEPSGWRYEEFQTENPWKLTMLDIVNPPVGLWTVDIDTTAMSNALPDDISSLVMSARTNQKIHFDPKNPEVSGSEIGKPYTLVAWVEEAGRPVEHVNWSVDVDGQPVTMYDDGTNGDTVANDNIFGMNVTPTEARDYNVTAKAKLPSGATAVTGYSVAGLQPIAQ